MLFFMEIFFGFLLSIFLFGCHEPEKDYPLSNTKDINEVLKTVIAQQTIVTRYDSTGMGITGKSDDTHFNSLDGFTLNIDLSRPWSKDDLLLNHIESDDLFYAARYAAFMKTDSLYILFQCHLPKRFKIDTTGLRCTTFTSEAEVKILKKRSRKEYFSFYYYQMSMPLFSLDQTQAYVMLDSYYNYMAAEGYAFFLKKVNSKWKIIWQDLTWQT